MAGQSTSVAPNDAGATSENISGSAPSEAPTVDSPTRRTLGARPGGRSERVVREILEAAAVELGRSGYAKLAIDEIAARAGVAKTTIYRRWPTKAELVTAALRALRRGAAGDGAGTSEGAEDGVTDTARREIDTGALRSDLLALLRHNTALTATDVGKSIARMLHAELDNPEVEAIARELRAEYRAPFVAAIDRAIARGEVAQNADPALVAEVLAATVFTRSYKMREPVDDAYLEKLVDLVLYGIASRKGRK